MDKKVTADTRELPDISQEFKAKKDGDNGPREIRVQHAHGGLKGRWTMNSMTIIMAALAIVTIFVTTISASYYYNNIRQNLYTRVTQSASFINRFLNSSYDQFLSASESFVANVEDKDKLEIPDCFQLRKHFVVVIFLHDDWIGTGYQGYRSVLGGKCNDCLDGQG